MARDAVAASSILELIDGEHLDVDRARAAERLRARLRFVDDLDARADLEALAVGGTEAE